MPNDAGNAAPSPTEAQKDSPIGLPPPPLDIARPALFLDMDGVLAPMAPTPDAVVPTPRRAAVLRRLNAVLDGRVAIVSGRTLAEIDRISGTTGLAASGVHGLERRRTDGSFDTRAPAEGVAHAVEAFQAFADRHPGVIVERKGVSAGLHFRQAPDVGGAAEALARDLARETGLTLQPGSMVLELKTPGFSKGTAVEAFMAEPPFAGAVPIMLGDDLTDEDGFEAAARLGGFGVLVGPMRPTAARARLDGVDPVLDWLERIAEANA